MSDMFGDMSQAIDDMINEQTSARFVGGMRSDGDPESVQLSKAMTARFQDVIPKDLLREFTSMLKYMVVSQIIGRHSISVVTDGWLEAPNLRRSKFLPHFTFHYPKKEKIIGIIDESITPGEESFGEDISKALDFLRGELEAGGLSLKMGASIKAQPVIDEEKFEEGVSNQTIRAARAIAMDSDTKLGTLGHPTLPSQLRSKAFDLYRKIILFLNKNESKANKAQKKLMNVYQNSFKDLSGLISDIVPHDNSTFPNIYSYSGSPTAESFARLEAEFYNPIERHIQLKIREHRQILADREAEEERRRQKIAQAAADQERIRREKEAGQRDMMGNIKSQFPGGVPFQENLNEDKLNKIVIDFNELRKNSMNESFLAMFGGWIQTILKTMFGGGSLPMAFRGSERDVKSFANTIGSEKRYIETAKRYGLDHATTYRNKSKLDVAAKNFEKDTGIKWPFK
jgi:hypothetical protein